MPADYSSAAAALSLSPSPGPSPSSSPNADGPPPWIRPRLSHTTSSSNRRRLSAPYSRRRASSSSGSSSRPLAARVLRAATAAADRALALFGRLSPLHRALAAAALAALLALVVLALVYSHQVWSALGPVAKGWRALPAGWLIVWALVFVAAFPPLVGYSTACTVAGFVYGFPLGWPIAATATVAGSAAAFGLSRGVASGYVHRLVGRDRRFVALGQVLRRDGLLVLTGVRFCPLPYSLSNGFLATVPSISVWSFALSTALASPKLLAHIFIGSRLAIIAEEGDSMSTGAKAVNYLSAAAGGLVGTAVAVFVYRRTMARAAELAREEGQEGLAEDLEEGGGGLLRPEYADDGGEDGEEGEGAQLMMDPDDADAAALMDGDDISLWEAGGGGDGDGGYRDVDEEEEEEQGDGGKKSGFGR